MTPDLGKLFAIGPDGGCTPSGRQHRLDRCDMPHGTCVIPGCGRYELVRRGWCTLHYQRWQKHGDPLWEPVPHVPSPCSADGCGENAVAKGYCGVHYARVKNHGTIDLLPRREAAPCAVEGCETMRERRDWCTLHYTRWKRYGDPLKFQRERNNTPPDGCTAEGCGRPHKAKGLCERHYGQASYLKRQGEIRARHAQHYRDNPEMYSVKSILRNRMLASVPMDTVDRLLSAEYRKAIKGDPCAYCGRSGEETDHAFPVLLGGTEHWWNLVRSCLRCNRSKGPHCGTWFTLMRGPVDESRLAAAVA